ncbi:O-methyltransferase [Zhihengliuella halotolerans]|uniref:Putative O-methyltransferase YrrM n=1 Tax=Zhihengliuella halotolerans TaxID=370736 RepID=A0A4Q8ABC7_9MICC|nr:O-methyltransferase [Zhihengliuella halotolerans]RZU60961.1 putative O-methyltransferase YrrM [Zhihengliuella halotolerans]
MTLDATEKTTADSPEATVPVNRYASAQAWRDVDAYFTAELVNEDSALVTARESGARTTMPNAEVAANQGALLGLITQIAGAKRVLEFGTLAGYSTVWFARAVGNGGRVVTFELEEQNALIARENLDRAGIGDRVEVVVGSAAESAASLIDADAEPFDLVFIDADKPSNPKYLAAALALTRPGAVIIIDNVVRDGAVVQADSDDPRVQGVRTVAQDIAAHPDLDATAIQTVGEKGWDGLIIARRR